MIQQNTRRGFTQNNQAKYKNVGQVVPDNLLNNFPSCHGESAHLKAPSPWRERAECVSTVVRGKISRGFTLIELLVVVFIIGILAAVALPQYQKAVDKSRFQAQLPKLKAIAEAVYLCELHNGGSSFSACNTMDSLDIKSDATCQPISGALACGIEFNWFGYRVVRLAYRMQDGTLYFDYPIYPEGIGNLACIARGAPSFEAKQSDLCIKYGFKLVDGKYILQ